MNEQTLTLRVNLGERSYDIAIGEGALERLGSLVAAAGVSHAVVVTDENVDEPHGRRAAEGLAEEIANVDVVVVVPGERAKSVPMAEQLWERLVELRADRKTAVVAVGGGVIGDLAGFIAATYARGLPFYQVPTTLLAMVDSSVGGKVGINLPTAKNMVGAFLQPKAVLIDTATLETLPDREYLSGLGEVVKYGVILDAELFADLEANVAGLLSREPETLARTIARCCRLKADVVEKDEREETGLRAILNYGHTFAHVFETLTGYGELLHGEAVAMGMIAASRLAERLGRIPADVTRRQHDLLAALGLPTESPAIDSEAALGVMMRDKKVAHGRLRFVLPDRLGSVGLVGDIPAETVREVLSHGRDEN